MGRKAAGRLTNVKAFRGRTMKLDDGFDGPIHTIRLRSFTGYSRASVVPILLGQTVKTAQKRLEQTDEKRGRSTAGR